MRKLSAPMGRLPEALAALTPEQRQCAATKAGRGVFDDYTIQIWTNRPAMARSIRMQEKRAGRADDWRAVVKLTDGEGF